MDKLLKTCPHLGMADDPETLIAFPSEWNCCHRANPIAAVQPGHQRDFCLSPRFVACPVFLRERRDLSLPSALRAPRRRKRQPGILGWLASR